MAAEATAVDVMAQIEQLERVALDELRAVKDSAALEQYRIKYLGANGQLKAAMKWLGQVAREQKPAVGQRLNGMKEAVTAPFHPRKIELSARGGGAPGEEAGGGHRPGP